VRELSKSGCRTSVFREAVRMRLNIFSTISISLSIFLCISRRINADTVKKSQTGSSEDECVDVVLSLKKEEKISSFVESMRRGFWECAKSNVASGQLLPEIDYKGAFDVEERMMLKEMASLKSTIESYLPVPSINCPFKWAQSPTEIMLSVKFSHKIDAPATLNVIAKNVTLTPDRLVLLASNGAKNFNLDIEFMGNVVPSESSWSMASVGRMTFTIKKLESPSKWASITKDNKKMPQMHFWWEMQEKFSDELDKLEDQGLLQKDPVPVPTVQASALDTSPIANSAEAKSEGDIVEAAVSQEAAVKLSAEELSRRADSKQIEDDYKKKLAAVSDLARRRKKDIDTKAKQDKGVIDSIMAADMLKLEQAKAKLLQVPAVTPTASDEDDL
jgi:CS domain